MVSAMVDDIPSKAAVVQVVEQGPAIPAMPTTGFVVAMLLLLAAGSRVLARNSRELLSG